MPTCRRGAAAPAATVGVLLSLTLLGTAVLAGCSGGDDAAIRVQRVGRATVTEVVEAPAVVTARATATVSAAADGTVTTLLVRNGQQVRRGQVLLRIDSPSARAALRQATEADTRAAAAALTPPAVSLGDTAAADTAAQQAFARARQSALALQDPQARAQALAALRLSQSQYEAARAQARQSADQLAAGLSGLSAAVDALAAAQRVQTRAALTAARRTVAALTVRAPIAGTVTLAGAPAAATVDPTAGLLDQLPDALQQQAGAALGQSGTSVSASVAAGAPVAAGQPLVTITDASALSLTATVDETDVLLVAPGVAATAELDAVPGASYSGRVVSVDATPTTAGRGGISYPVQVGLGPGREVDGSLAPTPRPGMSAVVALRVRTARDVVAVPASAVIRDGRRDAVFVVVGGRIEQRTVRLGAQGQARVQVVEGLKVGQRVVVRGADRVRDGQRL